MRIQSSILRASSLHLGKGRGVGPSGWEICPVLRTIWLCFPSVPVLVFMCLFVVLGKFLPLTLSLFMAVWPTPD